MESPLEEDTTERPAFSVILPCFNEGDGIVAVVERVSAYLARLAERWASELIVVDDGSTDRTAAALRLYSTERPNRMRLVTHPANAGLNAAMRTGAAAARSGTLVFLDADLSYAPQIVEQLVAARCATGAALAIASPYMKGGRVANVPLGRLVASRGANWLLSRCVGGRLKTFTGMVRAYDAAAFRVLHTEAPPGEFNAAMVAAALRRGWPIVEVPAALVWPPARAQGASRVTWTTLYERTRLVLATIRSLRASGTGWVQHTAHGSFALVQRPHGLYSGD